MGLHEVNRHQGRRVDRRRVASFLIGVLPIIALLAIAAALQPHSSASAPASAAAPLVACSGDPTRALIPLILVAPAPTPTINTPPSALDCQILDPVGTAVSVDLSTRASDPDGDTLLFQILTLPAHGTVSLVDSVATYVPNAGYAGSDVFLYEAEDQHGNNATAQVQVTVMSPTSILTPTIASTTSPTVTLTNTPSPSLTPLPAYPGQNVAPYAVIWAGNQAAQTCPTSTSTLGATSTPTATATPSASDPCAAIDNNPSTYWAPTAGSPDPQGLNLQLASGQYSPTTDSVGDIRVSIQSNGTGGSETYQVTANGTSLACNPVAPASGYPDGTQLDCPIASPTPGVSTVSVLMFHATGIEDGSYGVREVQVFKLVSGLATFTPCPTSLCTAATTATSTNTPTALATFSATSSPTWTSTVAPTATSSVTPCSPTCTPTRTPSAMPTATPSVKPTLTTTPTAIATPTPSPSPTGLVT